MSKTKRILRKQQRLEQKTEAKHQGGDLKKNKRKREQGNDGVPPSKKSKKGKTNNVSMPSKIKKFQCTDCSLQYPSWAECLAHLKDQQHGGPPGTRQEEVKMMNVCRIIEAFIKKPKATTTGEDPVHRFKCPDCETTDIPMRFHQWSECFGHMKQVRYQRTHLINTHVCTYL